MAGAAAPLDLSGPAPRGAGKIGGGRGERATPLRVADYGLSARLTHLSGESGGGRSETPGDRELGRKPDMFSRPAGRVRRQTLNGARVEFIARQPRTHKRVVVKVQRLKPLTAGYTLPAGCVCATSRLPVAQ